MGTTLIFIFLFFAIVLILNGLVWALIIAVKKRKKKKKKEGIKTLFGDVVLDDFIGRARQVVAPLDDLHFISAERFIAEKIEDKEVGFAPEGLIGVLLRKYFEELGDVEELDDDMRVSITIATAIALMERAKLSQIKEVGQA
jgi:hypothetical protein